LALVVVHAGVVHQHIQALETFGEFRSRTGDAA
jgi:hypothetical protein